MNDIIQSPLNYTGGKYKLLPQILPYFPKDINLFVDLFCGGCNVGINIKCNNIVYNDINKNLLSLYELFKEREKQSVFDSIYQIINKYNLSLTSQNGYEFYGCESSKGLSNYNKPGFKRLRNDLNEKYRNGNLDDYHYIMLYVLIIYSFNNQIRFNAKGEFNLPVGKRDFNNNMQQKLSFFIDRIKEQNPKFTGLDFRDFDIAFLTKEDFVYIDPPYLISCATYNEQGAWSKKDELDLLHFIDELHRNKIRFALSNVLRNKGIENELLIKWSNDNKEKYKLIPLNYSYSNSNYQIKNRDSISEEILIINY